MPSIARGLTSDGAHHLGEAGVAGLVHRHVDQRELQLGADAGQEVEARARHLGAALEVDRAEHPAELDVVARLEVELRRRADGLEHDVVVLAAGRRLVGREVGDLHQRRAPGLLGLGLGGLGGLHLGREVLGARQQRRLLLALRLRDLLAELLLLGPLGLEGGDRLPPCGVGGQGPVDHLVGQPALGLRGAHPIGVVAQHLRVDHRGRSGPAGHGAGHAARLSARPTVSTSVRPPQGWQTRHGLPAY